jgi:hypothetical protein
MRDEDLMTIWACLDAVLTTISEVYLPLTGGDHDSALRVTLGIAFHDASDPTSGSMTGFVHVAVTRREGNVQTLASSTRAPLLACDRISWITVSDSPDFSEAQIREVILDARSMMRHHACALFDRPDTLVSEVVTLRAMSLVPKGVLPPASGDKCAPPGDSYDMIRIYGASTISL